MRHDTYILASTRSLVGSPLEFSTAQMMGDLEGDFTTFLLLSFVRPLLLAAFTRDEEEAGDLFERGKIGSKW